MDLTKAELTVYIRLVYIHTYFMTWYESRQLLYLELLVDLAHAAQWTGRLVRLLMLKAGPGVCLVELFTVLGWDRLIVVSILVIKVMKTTYMYMHVSEHFKIFI